MDNQPQENTQEQVTITMPETEHLETDLPIENPQLQHNDIQPQKEELSTNNPQGEKPKLGRPCKFCEHTEEIMKITNEYVDSFEKLDKTKSSNIPYFEELCLKLRIDEDTISNWANKKKEDDSLEHPQFFGAYKKLNIIQKLRLRQRTLGRFNPTGAIFQLKANHGMIETEKQLLGNVDDKELRITIVEEEK